MHEGTVFLIAIVVRHEDRQPIPSLTIIISLYQYSLIATKAGSIILQFADEDAPRPRREVGRSLFQKLDDVGVFVYK